MKKRLRAIGMQLFACAYIPFIAIGSILFITGSGFRIIAFFLWMDWDKSKSEYEALKKLIR